MAEKTKLDRRVVRTRRLLRDALMLLILEKGYGAVTVQDITDRANLGRATFYLHYKDKEELLFSSLEKIYNDLVAHINRDKLAKAPDDMPQAALVAFSHAREHANLYRVILCEDGTPSIANRIRNFIAEFVLDTLRASFDAKVLESAKIPLEIVAHNNAGGLLGLITWWLEEDMPHDPNYMAQTYVRLVLPGTFNALGETLPDGWT